MPYKDPGCKRRWQQTHGIAYYERNSQLIKKAKDVPCVDCGERYPPYVMDFDHVRGEKRTRVGNMMYYSVKALEEEISKCEVVCANCHRERTHGRA
jgi:hypothetical protein